MPGPKPPEVKLTEAEREGLEKLVGRRTAENQKVLRGRIVLLAATGKNTPEIAKALGISLDMTRLWRRRWLDLQPIGFRRFEYRGAAGGLAATGSASPNHSRPNLPDLENGLRKARKVRQTDQPMDRERNCGRDCEAGDLAKHFPSPCLSIA
jgi:hypothetical protein